MSKIKATDLRIGNWVYFEDEKLNMTTFGKIDSMVNEGEYYSIKGIDQWGDEFDEGIIDIAPIPLTSEILLACGFENKIRGNYYHKEFTKLYVNIDNSIAIYFGNKNGILKRIDYLHELQNIFWILTNQELEFKTELR